MIRCRICSRKISGRYYTDWRNTPVCGSCKPKVVSCSSCSQFCIPGETYVDTGYPVCRHCKEYRIKREDLSSIIKFIGRVFSVQGLEVKSRWHIKMLSGSQMKHRAGSDKVRGLAERKGDEYTVYLFQGLSKVAFASVLAHELLHIFQYERNLNPPQEICEGFCNLGSYIVLSMIPAIEAKARLRQMLSDPDPIYGDGFRKVLSIYKKEGIKGADSALRVK